LPEVQEITERILYRLSLDAKARALAVSLLERFRRVVGDLPASADHHHSEPGGLLAHSLEVALSTLEAFEGNIIMERKPDGSVDSFQSARNRPRWQYASFIAALCHDLGKLFDVDVRAGDRRWCPLQEAYLDFADATRKPPSVSWRSDRQRGSHAVLSSLLLHHLLLSEDVEYLGLPRLIHLVETLNASHSRAKDNPTGQTVRKADQGSVERAHVSLAARPDSKIGQFLEALEELISGGELGINVAGGQVYVSDDKAAVVVPLALDLARDRLRERKVVLPPNIHFYNMLRNANLVEADKSGHCVRKIKVQGKQGNISLSALIFPTDKVVPKQILPTLPPIQLEIEMEPEPELATVEEE
jgi:DNA relaxase TraI-like protein